MTREGYRETFRPEPERKCYLILISLCLDLITTGPCRCPPMNIVNVPQIQAECLISAVSRCIRSLQDPPWVVDRYAELQPCADVKAQGCQSRSSAALYLLSLQFVLKPPQFLALEPMLTVSRAV